MPRKKLIQIILGLALVLIFGITGFRRSLVMENPILHGETMGAGYTITIAGKVRRHALSALSGKVTAVLAEVNRQMSTWDPKSEISVFNTSTSTGPFQVSAEFVAVVRESLRISESTGGAFDPTLNPLINLWGFGSTATERVVPSDDAIQKTKALTGWRHLHIDGTAGLRKDIPELQLDLGAIAPGYVTDEVAARLLQAGFENWFVEIGGEVRVRGLNPEGRPWRIGVQYPGGNPMREDLEGILHMTNGAVATSGYYYNYTEQDGVIYAHILDPATGYATHSDVASVTVVTPGCAVADGLATAMIVMGAQRGLEWIEQQPETEALFLVRTPEGKIIEKFSSGFKSATLYTSSHCP